MTRQQFIKQVECNQRAVRRFLTALCSGDTALADDIAQDTLIKAYMKIDTLKDESSFVSWLYRIAYTTCLTYKRGKQTFEDLSKTSQICGYEASDRQFEYQALYMAIDRLSANERWTILLHYMEGYSVEEIAGITESTQDAVKQRLSRGRQHLKTELNK